VNFCCEHDRSSGAVDFGATQIHVMISIRDGSQTEHNLSDL